MNKLKSHSRMLYLLLVILLGGTILTSVYTVRAYEVAEQVLPGQGQNIGWPSSPDGSFYPWPQESGPLTAVTYEDDAIDLVIYHSLLRTNFLLLIVCGLWFAVLTLGGLVLIKGNWLVVKGIVER